MIEYNFPDDDFNLRNVGDEVIFNAIKNDVVNVVKTFQGYENTTTEVVRLNPQYTIRKDTFGKDKNLYHNITLDIGVKSYLTYDSFNLFITPFEIKIAPCKYEPQIVEDENLTKSFVNFMVKNFPKSNYLEKRKEYFKNVKIFQRVEDDLLFFN